MGREGDWTPNPPPPAGPAPPFSGPPQQNSAFPRPPGPNQGPPGSQVIPGYGPPGQPMPPGSVSASQPWSGPPAFRPPLSSGPPNAGPPGARPSFANSSPHPLGPGLGRGAGPVPQQPGLSGPPPSNVGRGPQQQPGGFMSAPPSNVVRGTPTGSAGLAVAAGAPPPPAGYTFPRPGSSLQQTPPIPAQVASSNAQFPSMLPPQQRSQPGTSLAAGQVSIPGGFPGAIGGPRGPISGPPPSQPAGPRSSGPAPPSSQFQNLNLGPQSQGAPPYSNAPLPPPSVLGTPAVGVTEPGAPPAWQAAAQAVPPGPPRRTYPDTFGAGGPPPGPPVFGGPSVGVADPGAPPAWQAAAQAVPQGPPRRIYPDAFGTGGPQPGSGGHQHYQQGPSHLPPSMGHVPGVMENYGPGVAGMSQPGSPATAQNPPSSTSRIDPNQIPRPIPGATSVEFETRVNGQANLPPSATANFVVRDTGNCSPRFMRSTLNQIPCSGDLLATSGMPLAVMVQPFALPHPSEEPIQVVDFGESGPVRCSRCKAYVNHFMKFIDQGRRFTCNLCGFTNETPRDYHCNLGPDGRRRDVDQRPELSRGTVEFVASKEYLVRPPMPAVYYFLVDVSSTAVQTGSVAASCSAINRALSDLPEGPQTMVGIATFDSTIHFYSLNKNLQQAAMLVVPDIQDVYTPLQSDLIVPLIEAREHLEQLLESIPSMFQNNRIPESAFGAAIKGAFLAMKSTGGKLLVFQSVLPSIGIGALTPRESEGRVGGEKEYLKLFQPSDKTLKTMAIEFAEFQVCVDLFLTSQKYLDIASLSVVPRTTGGQVYYYNPFYAGADSAKLYNDLRWNVTRPQGLEAVMRVRCSQGLQVQEYHGNFCKRIPTDVDLPAIDSDKTIMVTFKHDDKFQEGSECCFQCALLYTTLTGQRRIRVITLSLSCTTVLSNLFRGADLDAQFTYLLKHAAQEVPTVPLSQVREQITTQCVNILYTYRKFCATASSSGQLILPEALKLLPLYTLALNKSAGLRTDARSDTHVDERAYWLARVASLPASLSIPLVYPRMFSIHNLPPKEAMGNAILPPVVPLSSENLDQDGLFLLETGEDAYLYVGRQASIELLQQHFGVSSVDDVVTGQFVLPVYDNEASKRLNEIVNEIRRQRCSYLRLRLLRRGDPLEFLFFSFLVEDKSSSGLSYVEFLVHVHRQIQNKMT